MLQFHLKPVPHDEAARLIADKAPVTRDVFDRLSDEIQARAFVVTGIESHDVLQSLRDRIAELPQGADWDKVKKDVVADLSAYMTMEDANRRASILMRHHGFSAYASSQANIQDKLADIFQFRQYISTDDLNVRPTHAALNGIVLPANHPFWQKHTPPWEWNCRCDVVELTDLDMEEEQARDKRRKPENRRVLEGAALKQLESGTLNRGPNIIVDVRTAREKGGNYENNVRSLSLPYDEIKKRWDAPTRQAFEAWAATAEAGDKGTVLDWLLERAPSPLAPGIAAAPSPGALRKSPVSTALKVGYRTKAHLVPIADALAAIDEVHDDGALPPLPVAGSTQGNLGIFMHYASGDAARIAVKSTGPWPALTTAHEIGHFLDYSAIGGKGFASDDPNGPLAGVIAACQASKTHALMLEVMPKGGYFETRTELWARAYSQYIAEKSSSPRLKKDLVSVSKCMQPWRQWPEEDFRPIRQEIDKAFTKLNWHPKVD